MNNILRMAIWFTEQKLSVIPVKKDKTPYFSWAEFQTRQPTLEEVRGWWEKYPDANLAVILPPSCVVLDIDEEKLAKRLISSKMCQKGRAELTPSGGLHLWFREKQITTKTENLRAKYDCEGEIRAFGSYIVVPPSDGYKLISDAGPIWVDCARDEIIVILKAHGVKEKVPTTGNVATKLNKGERNTTLTSLAGGIFKQTNDYQKGLNELKNVNRVKCEPPLSEYEVENIARSIYKREHYKQEHKTQASVPVTTEKKWRSLKEIRTTVDPKIDWTWECFLGQGFITLFSGLPKVGKTTIFFQLLKSLQENKSFLGFNTHRFGKTLIIAEENVKLYSKRVEEMRLPEENIFILSSFDIRSWPWDAVLDHIERAIKEEGISLLIIDTLGAFWNIGDENDAPRVQREIDKLKNLVQKTGVSSLLISHLRKADGEHGTRNRGSGAITGAVDVLLEFRHTNSINRRVIISHSRFHETPKEILCELKDGKYEGLGSAEQVEQEEVKRRFIEALSEDQYETPEQIVPRMGEPAPSKGMLASVVKYCREQKLVSSSGKGVRNDPFKYKSLSSITSTTNVSLTL